MKNSIIEKKLVFFESWVIFMGLLLLTFLIIFLDNIIFSVCMLLFITLSLRGFFIIQENESIVGVFFGKYIGTLRQPGFFWINPLINKKRISIKINTYILNNISCYEENNFPIEFNISFSWQIIDTAKALFGVENYFSFLEYTIKSITTTYINNISLLTLKSNILEHNQNIMKLINNNLEVSGLEISNFNILNLCYSKQIEEIMHKLEIEKELFNIKLNAIEDFSQHIQEILQENDFFVSFKGSDEEKDKIMKDVVSMFFHFTNNKTI